MDFIPLMALILTLTNVGCMTVAESWCMAMADISKLEQQANLLMNNVAGWEQNVLTRIGKRIKKYGKLSLADVKSINNVAVVKQDMDAIIKELAKVTGYNISKIEQMYGELIEEQHLANQPLYDYRGKTFVPFKDNRELQAIARAYAKTTGETMINLAKTKALCIIDHNGNVKGLQKYYTDVLDKAVMQVTTGATDFHTAMRDSIIELGGSGVRVDYGGGVTRRLDTAVRQNLLWGAKQASTEYNTMIGEELGCDGIEVDWHSNPRPSHAFMQGKQYVLGKARTINGVYFESADEALERLQDYGCLHYKTPIICGISEPRYSAEELKRLNEQNAKRYTIDGKEYSGYEVTQMQRRLESSVRNEKTTRELAKASGDNALVKRCNERIKAYQGKYDEISEITGIQGDKKRMSVPRGTSVKGKTTKNVVDVPKTIEQVNERGTKGIEKIVNDRIDSQRLNLVKPKDISKSGINPYSVDLTGIKARNADAIVDTVEELSGKYKTTIQGYRTGKKGEFLGRSGTFATTEYNSTTASSDIVFNKAKVDDIDRIKELSQKGWSVKVKEGLEDRYIVTHEFAHTVVPNTTIPLKNYVGYDIKPQQSARRELNSLFGEYKEKVQGLQKEYKQTEFDFIMGDVSAGEKARALKTQLDSIKISDYSLENVDEFMAEAFTSHEIGTVHTEYEKRVMDIIIKYFGK